MGAPSEKFTKNQLRFLLLFALTQFINFLNLNFKSPLYPPEAKTRGVSPSTYGLIMAFAFVTTTVLSFFITGIEKIGLRLCFSGCSIIGGLSSIVMGLLHYITSYWAFVAASIISSFLDGVTSTILVSSTYLVVLNVFASRTATAIGVVETSFLTASCIGPFVGEVVFTYVGYTTTYILFGVVQICIGIFTYVTLPPIPSSSARFPTFKEMMHGYSEISKFPTIVIFVVCLVTLEMGNDFVSTILEPGLRSFNLTPMQVGWTFLSKGLPQLLGLVWGLILDKLKRPELFFVASLFIMACSTIVLHYSMAVDRVWTMIGLALYGFGYGMGDLAGIFNFQLEVKAKGVQTSTVNFSFIAVVYTFTIGAGGILGSSLAGILFDIYGFANAIIFMCIIYTIPGIVLSVQMILRNCEPRALSPEGSGGYQVLHDEQY